jgi:hypothetical protein
MLLLQVRSKAFHFRKKELLNLVDQRMHRSN